jgi:serine/threonine protein kinase
MVAGDGALLGIREGDLIAGKYRVSRTLGVGGMGVVVAARHLRLDEIVAIKLLLPEALGDEDALRRFEREARAVVKIKSEHVTRILDIGTLDSGVPFIVMEYLAGEDLADRLARIGPFAIEEAIEIVLQACEAIAEAHALGIVHRDLKPANLFCVHGADGRPSVKVLDFGISKVIGAGSTTTSALGITKTRAVMGSPYYMSPEQMESPRKVDARTDIWSLGVVLFQLLTDEVPFTGETLPQVCVNVATRSAPPLRKLRPDAPSGVEAIVARCLEKDPDARFANVAALAAALARFGPREAQTSLDRIMRTWRAAAVPPPDADQPRRRSTMRPVSGSIASWGATHKSLDARTKSAVGGSLFVLLAVIAGFTFARREQRAAESSPSAVLVAPPADDGPKLADPREDTESGASAFVEGRAVSAATSQGKEAAPRNAPSGSERENVTSLATGAHTGDVMPVSSGRTSNGYALPAGPATATNRPLPARSPARRLEPARAPTAETTRASASVIVQDSEANPYAQPPEPARSPSGATCTLHLNSTPPARVVLDGTPLGSTPRMGISVPTGDHSVQFHWPEGHKRATVSCVRGETKTVAVHLSDSPATEEIENPYR